MFRVPKVIELSYFSQTSPKPPKRAFPREIQTKVLPEELLHMKSCEQVGPLCSSAAHGESHELKKRNAYLRARFYLGVTILRKGKKNQLTPQIAHYYYYY